MDRRNRQEPAKPRFVLITPPVTDAAAFAPLLVAACGVADIAAVVLRLESADDSELLARIRTIAPGVQEGGAALLLDGRTHLVAAADADGVHVTGAAAVASVRAILQSDRIVGAGKLESRHDAMTAGESGADYVLFGEPDANGRRPALPALIERIAWWSELFVLPCVAYAAHTEEIAPLVRAGADFIALGEEVVWNAPEGPVAALTAAVAHLLATEPAQ